eukprot:403362023
MCFTYFLQGFRTFHMLSVKDLFRLYLNLEADYTQFLVSLISLPWSFKLIYGLIADNFPILGSRRKSYVIVNGFLQFATLFILGMDLTQNEVTITVMLIMNSMNMAFIDVVVDALMVQQSRRDIDQGSEDLQGLNWLFLAVGGISGSVCSAFFTQFLKPKYAFHLASIFGLIMVVFALFIDVKSENIQETSQENLLRKEGFLFNLKRNWKEIKVAVQIPEIYKTLAYLFLAGLIVPQFGDMTYYFQLNIIKFTKFTQSMLGVLSFISLLFGVLLYTRFFRQKEFRTMLTYGIYMNIFGCVMGLTQALRYNLLIGIDDITFVIFTSSITDTLQLALSQLPLLVLFAKITPYYIEATVFALVTGFYNFSNFTLSPMIGVLINRIFIHVTNDKLDNFYLLLIIQSVLAPIPLILLRLIPLRKDMHILQQKHHQESLLNESIQDQSKFLDKSQKL